MGGILRLQRLRKKERKMGFTRYWTAKKVDEFSDEFLQKVKNVIKKAEPMGVFVKDGLGGEGDPIIEKDYISLNGDRLSNEDYESFILSPQKNDWDFCKTGRQPYDIVVEAILKLAEKYGYVTDVSSDGENREALAERLFKEA